MVGMSRTFFTSDLHLGHARIIELAARPHRSLSHMHEDIVGKWNTVVGPQDTVWVLGDVALGPIRESLQVVNRLMGNLMLVPGNHDRCFSEYRKNGPRPQDFQLYVDVGFEVHSELVNVGVVTPTGPQVWRLSHFPYADFDPDPREVRYNDIRPTPGEDVLGRMMPLIHGHVHTQDRGHSNRQVHVGMDAWDFTPVSLEQVCEELEKGE